MRVSRLASRTVRAMGGVFLIRVQQMSNMRGKTRTHKLRRLRTNNLMLNGFWGQP